MLAAGLHQVLKGLPEKISPEDRFNDLQKTLEDAISFQGGFLRFNSSSQTPETGFWWLKISDVKTDSLPLSDRVEIELVNTLIKNPGSNIGTLDETICATFPGLMTPASQLVSMCLESYGEQDAAKNDNWQIRQDDIPSNRKNDLIEMKDLLIKIGQQIGYMTQKRNHDPQSFEWTIGNHVHFTLFLTASALLGKILNSQPDPKGTPLIVLPGGRTNLVTFKIKNNPLWQQKIDQGWKFVKYRHIRSLAKNPMLSSDNLEEQLALDPLTYTESQIRLL